jgi:hypothetical protein
LFRDILILIGNYFDFSFMRDAPTSHIGSIICGALRKKISEQQCYTERRSIFHTFMRSSPSWVSQITKKLWLNVIQNQIKLRMCANLWITVVKTILVTYSDC